MRSRVIPAQITTIEDRIAGSLNFTQILLLMVPIFLSAAIYILFPQPMKLTLYKVPVVLISSAISAILAIRIKGKIILQWLQVLLTYQLRPRFYLYNKNDAYLRNIHLPIFKKKPATLFKKQTIKTKVSVSYPLFELPELSKLENLIQDPRISLSYKLNGLGGKVNVAFKQDK